MAEPSHSGASPDAKRQKVEEKQASEVKTPVNDDEKRGWVLLSQGAEARVWKVPQKGDNGEFVICKERFAKAYRHPKLDEKLTRQRCRMEGRLLEKCAAVPALQSYVPLVRRVESPRLYLQYIRGRTVKEYINDDASSSASEQVLHTIATEMGRLIGLLHTTASMVHGDLTTSNILLLLPEEKTNGNNDNDNSSPPHLYLIDFGLAKPLNLPKQGKKAAAAAATSVLEERAVDLYVLERALASTHPQLPASFWQALTAAYVTVENGLANSDTDSSPTLQRLEQVRQRGRKRECFG